MIYQVGKKQCSNSGRKRSDIDPLERDFMVQPPSILEFPGPLTPPPTPLEFPIPSVVGVWVFSGTTHLSTSIVQSRPRFCIIYAEYSILTQNEMIVGSY